MGVAFAILIFIFVILLLFNSFIGLYAFTVVLYIKPGMFSSLLATARPSLLLGALTLLMVFLQRRKAEKFVFFKDAPSKWFVALGLVMCLSMITSIWRGHTYETILNFFKMYIAYFLIINLVTSPKRLRALFWAMVLSMAYIGVVSVQEHYASGAAMMGERMSGAYQGALFGDPNDMALGFIMLVPFLYFDLFRGKGLLRKTFQVGILAFFLWAIILTQSRGGFVGLGVMLIVLWLKSKYKVRLALIGIIVLAIFWQVAPQSFRERMMTIETAKEEDAAAISRLDSWKAGFNMMKSRAFGVGGGNYGEGFVQYRPEGAIDVAGMRRASHNMFVQVGGETGFIGLFVFLMMLLSTFQTLNRVKKKMIEEGRGEQQKDIALLADATFLSLVGYCASGFFLSQGYNFLLYYLVAFSGALEILAMEKRD